MNIDFNKSHPAMNIDDKRNLYQGFLRVSAILIGLIAILLIGMAAFLL